MADTARRVRCRTCGKEVNVYDAKEYNLGRIQYECLECYKRGCKDVTVHILRVAVKYRKEKEK